MNDHLDLEAPTAHRIALLPTELPAAGRERPHVANLVAERARQDPAALAVLSPAGNLSYSDLVARAARVTAALRTMGVRSGDLVAIAAERSPAMIVGLLAVLNAGAAYVPVDPQAPADRVRFMLQDSSAVCLLLTSATAARFGNIAPAILLLEDPRLAEAGGTPPDEPPPRQTLDGDIAYCIYTSGTTGTPKAVAVPHGALAHLVAWHQEAFGVTPRDRALQFANLAFDAATWEIWGTLCAGAALYLAPASAPSLAELVSLLGQHCVTLAFLPTPLVEVLIDSREPLPPSLRVVLTGGDRLRRSWHLLSAMLVNNYGPTECTVVATSVPLPPSPPSAAASAWPPIGRPIKGIGISVLDERLGPVGEGLGGQLFLRGAGLARGYLGRPDLTAERFLPDPYGPPGSRMYATGDLCRCLPDGTLDFVGRADSQVKLRGHRIELGEVEAALLDCDGIANVATAVQEDRQGSRHLIAYVIPREGAVFDVETITTALATRLPDYMLPTRWVTMDALPINPNGKIDRRALPVSYNPQTTKSRGTGAAPLTSLEKTLCRIWGELLGLAGVPVDASFRRLGGSSIQAIEAVARLAAVLGRDRVRPSLQGQDSVRTYARRVESSAADAGWPVLAENANHIALGHCGSLSRAQEQVCFLEHLDGAWRAYRSHALLRVRGALDIHAFEGAIDDLLARHDVLRSTFFHTGGKWHRQQVAPPASRLKVEDLSSLPVDDQKAALEQYITRELEKRFDLAKPPMIRWRVARLGPDEHLIVQSEHHSVHDGQSFRLIVRDLAELYSARVEERRPALPPVDGSYARFCAEEQAWFASHAFRAQLGDWVVRLRDIAGSGRVLDNHIVPGKRRFRGHQLRHCIDAWQVERLREISRAVGVSPFAMSLAAFGLVCGRLSRRDRFLVGTAVANRPGPDYRATVGMFVNAVAIQLDVAGQRPFHERALDVARELDFALARSAVPMNEVVRALNLSRTLSGETPFNACFSFHDSLPLSPRFAGLDVVVEEGVANGSAKFDLSVVGILDNEVLGGGMELLFEYDLDRLPREVVEHLASGVAALLKAAAEDPRACLEPAAEEPSKGAVATKWSSDDASDSPSLLDAEPVVDGRLLAVLEILRELMPEVVTQPDGDMFAAGFHSLLLMQFVSRCRDYFGRELLMQDIYRLGTPRRIAAALGGCSAVDRSGVGEG